MACTAPADSWISSRTPRARFRTSTSPTGSSWRRVSRDAVAPTGSRGECRFVTEPTSQYASKAPRPHLRRAADRLRGGPDLGYAVHTVAEQVPDLLGEDSHLPLVAGRA